MSVHKCGNPACSHFVDTEVQSFIRVKNNGVHYFCASACMKEWERQNMAFLEAANPFRKKPPRFERIE